MDSCISEGRELKSGRGGLVQIAGCCGSWCGPGDTVWQTRPWLAQDSVHRERFRRILEYGLKWMRYGLSVERQTRRRDFSVHAHIFPRPLRTPNDFEYSVSSSIQSVSPSIKTSFAAFRNGGDRILMLGRHAYKATWCDVLLDVVEDLRDAREEMQACSR